MARELRAPVIAVMGHIDHGKSSLLDYIRKSNVVAGEAGGITQHVSAYIAEHAGRKVTFLDTPGHEAFKALRARGAQAADIAILVVAADEGVMPQTEDALAAITEAKIPYVVAITKIDKNNADIDRAKNSMLEKGIYLEGLGGEIPYSPVSSKSGEGVPELLDLVLLAADLLDLGADADAPAEGFVLESNQDAKRGASATLIVKNGTLDTGSFVVAGDAFAPVRFIEDFLGKRIERAGAAEPVRISGFSKLPPAGTPFATAKNKKEAEKLTEENLAASALLAPSGPGEDWGSQSTADVAPGEVGRLPLVIKTDAAGSIDAILHELAKLSHPRASIRVLATGVGNVSEGDIKTAAASGGVVIAFHTDIDGPAREMAMRDSVAIESFTIIYELTERVSNLLTARAPKITVDEELGRAKILKVFSSSAKKQVIGARLESGALGLGSMVKIVRKDEELARGKIINLQQARADIKELRGEGEFGAEVEAKVDAAPGDYLIAFRSVES